jgi:hypothetical protein
MTAQPKTVPKIVRHAGPHLGMLAIIYMVLFNAGLCAVSMFGAPFGVKAPYWPGPWESARIIAAYFHTHQTAVLICVFLQFGSLIPLGIYSATAVSRLRFLGVNAAGPYIALFGGLMTVFDSAAAGFIMWGMIHPGIAPDATLTATLNYISYAFGGPGFSIPMGLLIAGICISAAFEKFLPKWIVAFGLVLAAAGELSWFNLVFPQALFLIPLVRFPGFIWLIAVGFALPKTVTRTAAAPREG